MAITEGTANGPSSRSKVPPYVLFSDSSLLEMLHTKPQSLLQMSHINGVGEKKLDRYGDDFLALIQQHA